MWRVARPIARWRGRLLAAAVVSLPVLVAAASAPPPVGAEKPTAWVLPSMVRATPHSSGGSRTTATLSAARGETESFQVVVHAGAGAVTSATVVIDDLRDGPRGATIPARSATLYREHFVHVANDEHSPDYSGPIIRRSHFPDALIPFVDPSTGEPPSSGARFPAAPFDIAAGRTQPVWIDVAVPRDTAPGTYTGGWTVRSDQGSVHGEILVHVYDFALPVTPAEDSSFGVYTRAERTRELLLGYDIQPTPVEPAREPDYRKLGLKSVGLGFWSGATVHDCTMDPPPSVRALKRAVATHDPALRIYNYTADEISECKNLYPQVRQWARRLHAAGAAQLITMVPEKSLLDDGRGDQAVDIWPILPIQFRRDLDPTVLAQVLAGGGEMWSYEALVQGARTPSWEIDFPAANFRILPGFLNQRMGVVGNLYWAVDYWPKHPWHDVIYRESGCCYPGDGFLVYPGRQAGVVGTVPSLRLAWIRDGMEDYGYVDILRKRGLGDEADKIIDAAAHSWSSWTQDRHVIADVRRRLAAAIEASNP